MVMWGDCVASCYGPASEQGRRYAENGYRVAREVAAWKSRVRSAGPSLAARRLDTAPGRISFGDKLQIGVAVKLNGLGFADVAVEVLVWPTANAAGDAIVTRRLNPVGPLPGDGEYAFELDFQPNLSGKLEYRLRVFPFHERLTHPFELGLMLWV